MYSRRIQINFSEDASTGSKNLTLVPRSDKSSNGNHATGVLHSWKEIAAYLNRGVRTVQRWESELGLPVHRPRGKNRSAVLAFREELDDWLRHTPSSSHKHTRTTLLEIACDLQNLAQMLAAQAPSEMRPEGENLLEAANRVAHKLAQLNGDSVRNDPHP